MHQINRGQIKTDRRVIDQGVASLEQLVLTRQAQVGVLFADHLAAFPLSSILRIDCRAVDGHITPALATKIFYTANWPVFV